MACDDILLARTVTIEWFGQRCVRSDIAASLAFGHAHPKSAPAFGKLGSTEDRRWKREPVVPIRWPVPAVTEATKSPQMSWLTDNSCLLRSGVEARPRQLAQHALRTSALSKAGNGFALRFRCASVHDRPGGMLLHRCDNRTDRGFAAPAQTDWPVRLG